MREMTRRGRTMKRHERAILQSKKRSANTAPPIEIDLFDNVRDSVFGKRDELARKFRACGRFRNRLPLFFRRSCNVGGDLDKHF